MGKQRRLVRQQLIEAAIQRVLGDQPIILAQQIRHRALLEPLPMQAPLAAGIDQPIAHQRLQDVLPAGAFARIRQQRCKEPIQLQLLIEMTGQPRRPPWGRAMPLHRIEPHLYPKALGMIRHPLLGRKQGKLPMPPAPLVEPLDHPAPRRVLTVVDLAQIQNRTLHHPTARTAPAFDNAPIPVLLAVLPSPCESQVHGPRFYAQTKIRKERRSSLHAFSPHRPLRRFSFFRQNSKIRGPVGKVGLAPDLRAAGAVLLIDATQSVGVLRLDVKMLDPDFVVFPTYKWLVGPYGRAFLYVAKRHQGATPLEQTAHGRRGVEAARPPFLADPAYAEGARRFDMGERDHFISLDMATVGIEMMTAWGTDAIARRLENLTAAIAKGVQDIDVRMTGRPFAAPPF